MKSKIKSFNYMDNVKVKFNELPKYPSHILNDNGCEETLTKGEFWESDIIGMDEDFYDVVGGEEIEDGKWVFYWEEGEISGFVEGEDFEFIEGN